MSTRLLLMAALVSACGTTPDERPATLEVVTLEVLKPSCGQVQCHSTTTARSGYAFDTVDAARTTFQMQLSPGELSYVIHQKSEFQMPPDWPLAQQDIDLVDAWVTAGAPGVN
jgi:hypothetical protein